MTHAASPASSPSTPKSFAIKNFGCQMNVYDGGRMADLLQESGMEAAEDVAQADLVVLNTCHIREKAVEKVYSDIGRLRRADGSTPMVALAGCIAQAEGKEIPRRAHEVDIVVGPQAYHQLPELITQAAQGTRGYALDLPGLDKFAALPKRTRPHAASAFLTIQEGCDKFCTYCVVPYTRGAEISRPFVDIMEEARALTDMGVKEITLLGQNVNAWEDGSKRLDALFLALDALPGLRRIRYMTSHPRDMDARIIAAHKDVESVMPFLHLPVQSGNDRILKAMNRDHDAASYLRLIERFYAARPDLAVSGDFIVGFPDESEVEFNDTVEMVKSVRYASAYSFKYSPRPGTPAAGYAGQVAEGVMHERLLRLQAEIAAHQSRFNSSFVGKRMEILLERKGRLPGQWIGKSAYNQSVVVQAPASLLGEMVEVEVQSATLSSLSANLINAKEAAS
jgi:tRNA-2-methylthio-N6-dimethylallyladenosine synthase